MFDKAACGDNDR